MSENDDDSIIHPVRTKKDKSIPSVGILLVNPGEARTAVEKVLQDGGKRLFMHNSNLVLTADESRFIAGPAVSAPVATLVMEKLIVLGAKTIIQMGWCGAIDRTYSIGDLVVPSGAVSGEGTSKYYRHGQQQADPSSQVNNTLKSLFSSQEVLHQGRIWSTDAPYRESRRLLESLRKNEGVVGVDMEFSALCNVAAFRGIHYGSILIVSDELWGESWKPGFKHALFRQKCQMVMEELLTGEL